MKNHDKEMFRVMKMFKSQIKTNKIEDLCRTCLAVADPPQYLFSEQNQECLADLIWECARIRPVKGDGLPESLCLKCYTNLTKANRFRLSAQRTDQVLLEYTQNIMKWEIKQEPDGEMLDGIKNDDSCIKLECVPEISDYDMNTSSMDHDSLNMSTDEEDDAPLIKLECTPEININVNDPNTDHENDGEDSSIKFEHPPEVNDTTPQTDSNAIITSLKPSTSKINDVLAKTKNNEKKFKCETCGKTLCSKYSLKVHSCINVDGTKKQLTHIKGRGIKSIYSCTECPYETLRGHSYIQHMRIHTGEKPFKCDECEKCFAQQSSLIVHKRTHSSETFYTCTECGKQFKFKTKYERHKLVHTNEKKYGCTLCNAFLKTKLTLKQHMDRHNNIRNFSCDTCGLAFVTREELTNHFRVHSAEKNHECHICGYKTYLKKALANHLKRHTGERSFKCDSCDLSFYTKGELKSHTKKHTKAKNYSCPICSAKFGLSGSVNAHMLNQHNIKYKWGEVVDRRVLK